MVTNHVYNTKNLNHQPCSQVTESYNLQNVAQMNFYMYYTS